MVRRLCRLTYHEQVRASLPDELQFLLPNAPGLNPDYIQETLNMSAGALRDCQAFMKTKAPADKIMTWFEESGKLAEIGPAKAARVLATAALAHGQKCITHHNVLLKRYEPALRQLTAAAPGAGGEGGEGGEAGEGGEGEGGEGCEHVLVGAAAGIWAGTHPHMAVIAVSRLLELGLCPPAAVARWLVAAVEAEEEWGTVETGPSRGVAWGTSDAWEIAVLAVEGVVADRDNFAWRWANFEKKLRATEAEAAAAGAEAEAAAARGQDQAVVRAHGAEAAAVERLARLEEKAGALRDPLAAADAAVAECAGGLALGLVRALAPKLGVAAAAAAGPHAGEAGKDAAPEPRDARALAFLVALLRRFRRQVGAAAEAEVHAALEAPGVAPEAAAAIAHALSGRSAGAGGESME